MTIIVKIHVELSMWIEIEEKCQIRVNLEVDII